MKNLRRYILPMGAVALATMLTVQPAQAGHLLSPTLSIEQIIEEELERIPGVDTAEELLKREVAIHFEHGIIQLTNSNSVEDITNGAQNVWYATELAERFPKEGYKFGYTKETLNDLNAQAVAAVNYAWDIVAKNTSAEMCYAVTFEVEGNKLAFGTPEEPGRYVDVISTGWGKGQDHYCFPLRNVVLPSMGLPAEDGIVPPEFSYHHKLRFLAKSESDFPNIESLTAGDPDNSEGKFKRWTKVSGNQLWAPFAYSNVQQVEGFNAHDLFTGNVDIKAENDFGIILLNPSNPARLLPINGYGTLMFQR